MEANQLPTKPGPYYWRESEGGEWEIAQINRCMDVYFVGCDMHYGLKKTGGEWLQIPTAEELVELQAAKKMVDEGVEAWAVFAPNGNPMIIAMTEQEVINETGSPQPKAWEALQCHGFTCEPVTIVRKEPR